MAVSWNFLTDGIGVQARALAVTPVLRAADPHGHAGEVDDVKGYNGWLFGKDVSDCARGPRTCLFVELMPKPFFRRASCLDLTCRLPWSAADHQTRA
jgi:hypothetical protein